MFSPQPKKSTNELLEYISKYTLESLPSEFETELLLREADKLKKVNASEGWVVSGLIYSLFGNYKQTVASFDKSLALSPTDINATLMNYAEALRQCGKFEQAHHLIAKYISDDNSKLIGYAFQLATDIGLINEAIAYQKKLKKFPSYDSSRDNYLEGLINCCTTLNIDFDVFHILCLLVLSSVYAEKKEITEISALIQPEMDDALIILFYVKADATTMSKIEWDIAEKMAELDTDINFDKLAPIIKSAN